MATLERLLIPCTISAYMAKKTAASDPCSVRTEEWETALLPCGCAEKGVEYDNNYCESVIIWTQGLNDYIGTCNPSGVQIDPTYEGFITILSDNLS